MTFRPLKIGVRLVGIAIAIFAGTYFLMLAHKAFSAEDVRNLLSGRALAAGAVLTLAYMALIPMTAIAWSQLLQSLGQPVPLAITTPILAATQLAKYLPGNIAHHVGRIVIARARGLDTGPAVLSIAFETLLTIVAGAHVSSLTLLWGRPSALSNLPLASHQWVLVTSVTIGAAVVIAVAPKLSWALMQLRGQQTAAPKAALHPRWSDCAGCYLLYATNFFLMGGGLWLAAKALSPAPVAASDFVLLVGAFASSWILGFLAPGAPAGLGVREAVLSLWLGTTFEPAVVVSLVIMLRIATTLGDFLSFLWGSLFFVRTRHAR